MLVANTAQAHGERGAGCSRGSLCCGKAGKGEMKSTGGWNLDAGENKGV